MSELTLYVVAIGLQIVGVSMMLLSLIKLNKQNEIFY